MSDAELIELMAKAISPYAWNDSFWQSNGRQHQYDRNQRHAKENARGQASDVLNLLVGLDLLDSKTPPRRT